METTTLTPESPTVTQTPALPRRGAPVRLGLMVVLLAAFWVFELNVYSVELAMFTRFISRVLVLAALLLVFLGWWLVYRPAPFRDRLLGVGMLVATVALVGLLSHESVGVFGTLLAGLPFCLTAWTLWLIVGRNASAGAQRIGLFAVMLLTFGPLLLTRWEGLDGAQRSAVRWRWTPTAEEEFLAAHASVAPLLDKLEEETVQPWTLQPGDWPEFAGPTGDGAVTGIEVATDWNANPPKLVWEQRVGPAWSSMIVVDGHLVTQEQRGEHEAVVCYDAATGQEIWSHEDEVRFDEKLSGAGPRSTPTFHNGRIYASGGTGKLTCLDAATGKLLWSHDVLKEYGGQNPQWGYSVSPLVVDGKVITFAGGKEENGVVAFDAETGKLAWSHASGPQSHSSPQLVQLGGQRLVLMHDNQNLMALTPDFGQELWRIPGKSEIAVPMLQSHVLSEDELIVNSDPGVARIRLKQDGDVVVPEEVWFTNRLKPGFNDFVVYDGHIYGLDDGILCCIDLEDGKRVWKKGRYDHGQLLLLADQGLVVVVGEKGEVALVRATPKGLEELGRFTAIEGKTWNHPTLAHGRLYVRNSERMACYALP